MIKASLRCWRKSQRPEGSLAGRFFSPSSRLVSSGGGVGSVGSRHGADVIIVII